MVHDLLIAITIKRTDMVEMIAIKWTGMVGMTTSMAINQAHDSLTSSGHQLLEGAAAIDVIAVDGA